MTIIQLFKRLLHFVRPYRVLVIATLVLTIIGSFLAQVNAYVLRYTVYQLTELTKAERAWNNGVAQRLSIKGILAFRWPATAYFHSSTLPEKSAYHISG